MTRHGFQNIFIGSSLWQIDLRLPLETQLSELLKMLSLTRWGSGRVFFSIFRSLSCNRRGFAEFYYSDMEFHTRTEKLLNITVRKFHSDPTYSFEIIGFQKFSAFFLRHPIYIFVLPRSIGMC